MSIDRHFRLEARSGTQMAKRPVRRLRAISALALFKGVLAALESTAARSPAPLEPDEALCAWTSAASLREREQLIKILEERRLSSRVELLAVRLLSAPGVKAVRVPEVAGLGAEALDLVVPLLLRPLGAALKTMDLRWVEFPDGSPHQAALCDALSRQEFVELTVVRLQGATDALLEAVAKGCPVLETLDLHCGSASVTLRGLRALIAGAAAGSTLREVVLGDEEEGVCPTAGELTVLLRGIPHLRSLGGACPWVTKALVMLNKALPRHPPLALERFVSQPEIKDKEAAVVAKLCPNLKTIHLERPEENCQAFLPDQLGALLRLSDLKHLESLCAMSVDIVESLCSVRQLLATGAHLTDLTLMHVVRGPIELPYLAHFCPHLKNLCLRAFSLRKLTEGEDEYGPRTLRWEDDCEDVGRDHQQSQKSSVAQHDARDKSKKRFLWPSLVSLELSPLQDGGVDRESLLEIVQGTPNLRTLNVGTSAEQLSDDDVPALSPPGNKLVSVTLRRDASTGAPLRLSRRAVLAFLDRCTHLTELGLLDDWSVSEDEQKDLRLHCRRNNLRVTLRASRCGCGCPNC